MRVYYSWNCEGHKKRQKHQGGDASVNKEENNKNEKQQYKIRQFLKDLLYQNLLLFGV